MFTPTAFTTDLILLLQFLLLETKYVLSVTVLFLLISRNHRRWQPWRKTRSGNWSISERWPSIWTQQWRSYFPDRDLSKSQCRNCRHSPCSPCGPATGKCRHRMHSYQGTQSGNWWDFVEHKPGIVIYFIDKTITLNSFRVFVLWPVASMSLHWVDLQFVSCTANISLNMHTCVCFAVCLVTIKPPQKRQKSPSVESEIAVAPHYRPYKKQRKSPAKSKSTAGKSKTKRNKSRDMTDQILNTKRQLQSTQKSTKKK